MQMRFTLRCVQCMATSVFFGADEENARWAVGRNSDQIPRCNQSFVSGLDSSQHRPLHWAFRSLLTDGINV